MFERRSTRVLWIAALAALSGECAPRAVTVAASSRSASVFAARNVSHVVALPRGFARGVAYSHDWSDRGAQGYGSDAHRAQLTVLREHGANWISVMPYAFARGEQAREIHGVGEGPGAERDALVERTIRDARERGMHVMLKPHLWVRGSWPGALGTDPAAARELARSWMPIVLHYAAMAERTRCDALAIGTEMDEIATRAPDEWRAIITAVRQQFHGVVTYCGNWSSYDRVAFWDALDVISVQDYSPRAAGVATEERVRALGDRTREVLRGYASFARRAGKPVWLTEVGFRCDHDALEHPWRWPTEADRCSDCALRARALDATLAAAAALPEVQGIFVWKWFTSGGYEDEGACGFAVNDPESRSVLRQWYSAGLTARDTGPLSNSPPR